MKERISSGQVAAARRIELKRGRFVLGVLAAVALCTASGAAQASTFSYSGGEQKFVVPAGDTAVEGCGYRCTGRRAGELLPAGW